jgi:HEPN domain-containing protein
MDEKQGKRFEFWKNGATEEITSTAVLLNNKELRQSLFFVHLSLEKILKTFNIKEKGEHPPITHSLKYIAEKIPLKLPEKYENFLIEATAL